MPNVVNGFINQQYNSEKIKTYDNIIEKLRCVENDEHCQLFEDDLRSHCDTPIFACKFALNEGYSKFLALANEDGKLAVVDVSKKNKRIGTWAHHNAIFDIAWTYNSMKITTASGDHTAKLFDVTNCDIREERIFYGHSRSVKTVSYRKDDPNVFATGGRDGNIMIWDTRTEVSGIMGKADRQIRNAHAVQVSCTRLAKKACCRSFLQTAGTKSVTSLVFRDDNNLISCAAGDGLIKVWDLRKSYHTFRNKPTPKCVIEYPGDKARNGFSNLIIDRNFTRLYANCLDNTIYCYNVLTFSSTPVMKYQGHQNNTFYVKSSLSSDGNYLISGSSDENAYIWRTNCSLPIIKLTGHKAEVTCVAWCQEEVPIIATCSDDTKHKIWRVDNSESHSSNWHYICRGEAEILSTSVPLTKIRLKRSNSYNTVERTMTRNFKKVIVQCEKCFTTKSYGSSCENCEKNNIVSKEKTSVSPKIKCVSDQLIPRRSLANLDQNVYENQCINKSVDHDEENRCESENITKSNDAVIFKSPTPVDVANTPTQNLPNFIVDGIAPHVSQSPIKRKDIDWLTKMRVEKTFKKEIFENYNQSSVPSSPRLEFSPRSDNQKKRSSQSQQTSLLRFFKVKNSKSDNLTAPNKPVNCTIVSALHSPSQ